MWIVTKAKAIRPGLITSISAAYTATEVEAFFAESKFDTFQVFRKLMGLQVVAIR